MSLLKNFEVTMKQESLKYMIQKQIFCKYSGALLDTSTAIMIDAFDKNDKLVSTNVIDGRYKSKLEEVKSLAKSKGLRLDIFTNLK